MNKKSNMKTYITICKIESWQEFAVWLRKLNQGLYINLEGWDGEGEGGSFKREDICITMADSCWGLTENSKILYSNYLSIKKKKKKSCWTGPWPPQQDPISPTASPSHQEAPQTSYPHPSEGRQNENHNHRKLTKLITWITALSNSMKLSSKKTWSTGEGNGKPLQYSCLENPMNVWKGKMIGYWKRNSPGQ